MLKRRMLTSYDSLIMTFCLCMCQKNNVLATNLGQRHKSIKTLFKNWMHLVSLDLNAKEVAGGDIGSYANLLAFPNVP